MNHIALMISDHENYLRFESLAKMLEGAADAEVARLYKVSPKWSRKINGWELVQIYKIAAQNYFRAAEMAHDILNNGTSESPDIDRWFFIENHDKNSECLRKAEAITVAASNEKEI